MAAEITLCVPYFPSVSTKVHECNTHMFSFPIWLLCHLARIPVRLLAEPVEQGTSPQILRDDQPKCQAGCIEVTPLPLESVCTDSDLQRLACSTTQETRACKHSSQRPCTITALAVLGHLFGVPGLLERPSLSLEKVLPSGEAALGSRFLLFNNARHRTKIDFS
jgi:hypothetical protein